MAFNIYDGYGYEEPQKFVSLQEQKKFKYEAVKKL